MLPSKMQVNKKLLPIKGHFFFFNAGTAPLVPYLSTYARQLGFSSATVGLIYTILPICGLIAKPLFGVIADRFKKQKLIFILFQIMTIVSFGAIYFIKENGNWTVELDCNDGVTMLQSCYKNKESVDKCTVNSLSNLSPNATANCQMNCNMASPKMWQTVCEHWHIPQYCYSNTNNIRYSSTVSNVTLNDNDNCAYISANNVTLDGHIFSPHCRLGAGYVDVNEPCSFKCNNTKLSTAIGTEKVNMTCIDKNVNYKLCSGNIAQLTELTKEPLNSNCEASCDLDLKTPWRLMEICEWWKADSASYCQAKTKQGDEFPKNLSFTGVVLLSTTMAIDGHECVYMRLHHIELPDDNGGVTIHYPNCESKASYQLESEFFRSSCEIRCNNDLANKLMKGASESSSDSGTEYTSQFWLFFFLMIVSWVGQAVVVTFADAICFDLLGTKVSHYGKQRLWGSVGWGIFSLSTGVLIDTFSDGAYKDYTIAFILMFVFMVGDVGVSCFVETDSTKMSMNILADVGSLLSSLPTFVFLVWTIAVGMCTGLLWQFLFWLIEDISGQNCDGSGYIKTLQGLVSAIQTFGGEIPFLFVSGYILKKVGHTNMMSLVLLAFGVRFIMYSYLTDPWWILPIEMLQGVTFGMFYPTMTSYANIVSPPGTETTVQGLVGAVFEGVGTSLGSFIGGNLYGVYGGWITFRAFGIGALVCCGLNWLAFFILKDKIGHAGVPSVTMPSRPSYAQLEGLVEFLEQNPGVAKGLLRTAQGKLETKRKWENLATTLNSLGGANKNGQGWAKYWAEKKCALKKQCAEVSASMRRTGGGTADNLPILSALDNRLVAVMGGQEFATGDARWTVNPFPQSTIPIESPVVIEHIDTVQEDMAMDSIRNISPIPSTSQNDAIPATSTIPAPRTPLPSATPPRPRRCRSSIRRSLDIDMEQMTRIEARRVEAELLTAQALTQLSENFSNITIALTSIANAISYVARKMPDP